MAVAEKAVAQEMVPRSPNQQLALGCVLGTLFVLFSLGMVFTGIPEMWRQWVPIKNELQGTEGLNEFLAGALLILLEILAAVGFLFLGLFLEKGHATRGLRAGIFFSCLSVVFLVLVAKVIGAGFEKIELLGLIFTLGIVAGLAVGIFLLFLRPGFAQWLGGVEDGGWFHLSPYKPSQGVRVRRGTFIALLAVGFCGIYTMVSHKVLGADLHFENTYIPNNWELSIPFWGDLFGTDAYQYYYLPVLFKVHYTVPIILAVLLVWLARGIVNWPSFADFLIATEAEMNKVSWTTRKRLFQDTVVVLVAVVLLTSFLFFVDLFWIKILEHDWIRVLQLNPKEILQKQQEKTQW